MRLRVHPGELVVLTVPFGSEQHTIREFLARHTQWLKHAVARMMEYRSLPVSGRRDYLKYKEQARAFLHERVVYWNTFYDVRVRRIAVKNTRRTWGSCSRKGNLNFSYALLFLPRELADYVVVHELCHVREPNHSNAFWAEVAKAMPNFAERRKELRKYLPRS